VLCGLADREKEKFSDAGNCHRNMLDLSDCPVANSRPADPLQRRPNSQTLTLVTHYEQLMVAVRPQTQPVVAYLLICSLLWRRQLQQCMTRQRLTAEDAEDGHCGETVL